MLIPATLPAHASAFALGAHLPGVDGLALALLVVMGMAVVASALGRVARAALQDPVGGAADAGRDASSLSCSRRPTRRSTLLTGWLHEVARYNPVTQILEAARQGFVGDVTWADTWPGLVALFGLAVILTAVALRGMRRATY